MPHVRALRTSLKPILAISATMRSMVTPAFSAAAPTSSSTRALTLSFLVRRDALGSESS